EFLAEQYWGYSGGAGRRTIEYQVEHPPWKLWPCSSASFTGDVARMYGPEFDAALSAPPASAYLADGSPICVFPGRTLSRSERPASAAQTPPHTHVRSRNLSADEKIG
ncbi:MAG: DUF2071 domain-containing protein, partial [Pirellulales bacterium]